MSDGTHTRAGRPDAAIPDRLRRVQEGRHLLSSHYAIPVFIVVCTQHMKPRGQVGASIRGDQPDSE